MGHKQFSRPVGNTPEGTLWSTTITIHPTANVDLFAPAGMRAKVVSATTSVSGLTAAAGTNPTLSIQTTDGSTHLKAVSSTSAYMTMAGRFISAPAQETSYPYPQIEFDDTIGMRFYYINGYNDTTTAGTIRILAEVFPRYE